jgi:hypothetical protein
MVTAIYRPDYRSLTSQTIEKKYRQLRDTPSDINQHLATLKSYAMVCNSVVECGTINLTAAWALLLGLVIDPLFQLDGSNKLARLSANQKTLTLCHPTVDSNMAPLAKAARQLNVTFHFTKGDDTKVELPEADLYFIDTWHVYAHLKAELAIFSSKAHKYMILHDTEIDGIKGEAIRYNQDLIALSAKTGYPVDDIGRGLLPAIDEFLVNHSEWKRTKVFTHNNGLTILARV